MRNFFRLWSNLQNDIPELHVKLAKHIVLFFEKIQDKPLKIGVFPTFERV